MTRSLSRWTVLWGCLIISAALFRSARAGEEERIDCGEIYATVDIVTCQNYDIEDADKELNAVYSDIMARLKKMKKVAVDDSGRKAAKELTASARDAQRAWIEFRDAEAAFQAALLGEGSAFSINYNGVILSMTKARTKELKEVLEGPTFEK